MFLHIGGDTVIETKTIITVCDLDKASCSAITREYLARAQKNNRVVSVSEDLPKSFIVCRDGDKETVYLSLLNTTTLLKRLENNSIE